MIVVLKNRKKQTKTMSSHVQNIPFTTKWRQLRRNMIPWWAQESHWWCHFSIWARKYPKTISKKHKVISLTRSAYELCGWGSVCFHLARSPLDLPWCPDELLASQTTESTTSSSFIRLTLSIHMVYIYRMFVAIIRQHPRNQVSSLSTF
jgi:hypothetical protein